MSDKRVFVGNVPFMCNKDEFIKCFQEMEGFTNGDVVRKFKSSLTRGFGFVEFDSKKNADRLMSRTDIYLKDRQLRFSKYSLGMDRTQNENESFKIFVKDIKLDVTEENIRKAMDVFGSIKKVSIVSKNGKNHGIVVFETIEGYKKALKEQEKVNFTLYPFMKRNNKRFSDTQTAYREGFNAGYAVGLKQIPAENYDHDE